MTVNQNVAGSIPAGGANVDGSSNGRAPDCGSGGCEFDSHPSTHREVVQSGRMRALGACGRRFESCLPYQAGVAQLVEQEFCKLQVTGSIPVTSSTLRK